MNQYQMEVPNTGSKTERRYKIQEARPSGGSKYRKQYQVGVQNTRSKKSLVLGDRSDGGGFEAT